MLLSKKRELLSFREFMTFMEQIEPDDFNEMIKWRVSQFLKRKDDEKREAELAAMEHAEEDLEPLEVED